MKNFYKTLFFLLTPVFVFAQSSPNNFIGLVDLFVKIINRAIPIIIAFALLGFFWGLAKFILNSGGGSEAEEAKNTMVWGIVILFVMVSFWGIISLLKVSFIP